MVSGTMDNERIKQKSLSVSVASLLVIFLFSDRLDSYRLDVNSTVIHAENVSRMEKFPMVSIHTKNINKRSRKRYESELWINQLK